MQQSHSTADRMVLLLHIYDQEDQAYQDLVTVATHFFQYLLQPFRDMRELACLYKMEILVKTHIKSSFICTALFKKQCYIGLYVYALRTAPIPT